MSPRHARDRPPDEPPLSPVHVRLRAANALRIAVNRRPHQLRMRTTGPAARRLRLFFLPAIRLSPSAAPSRLIAAGRSCTRSPSPPRHRKAPWHGSRTGPLRRHPTRGTRRAMPQLASARFGSQSSLVVASMRTGAGPLHSSSSVVLLRLSNLSVRHVAVSLPCLPLVTSFSVTRPRVALPARFDACRGERCSLPRVRVIRACVPDERSVPVSLLPGVGGTGETHC